MKRGKVLVGVAAAAGIAGSAYARRPNKKIPGSAVVEPLIRRNIWVNGMKLPACPT